MKKINLVFLLLLPCFLVSRAQPKTLQERLGYPKNTKLVIIHADDIGVSHAVNAATIQALEKGSVVSGSIMVPCPWFGEIAAYAASHPQVDLGLHLTLTSEWKLYKWGPVLPRTQVPSLVDAKGFFYPDVASLGQNGSAKDIEQELRGQIERARQFGINFTHFDTHMGSVMANPEFVKVYIKLGREFHVPVLLTGESIKAFNLNDFITDKDVVLDKVAIASPEDYKKGMKAFYTNVLKSLPPGVTYLILHAAYDNDEMQAVTMEHPDYGAAWRQADFDFFTSRECKQLIIDNHIQVITWREIRDKLLKQ